MKKLLLVMTIVSLTGCAIPQNSPGNAQIGALNSVKDLNWIKKGKTTSSQIIEKLGQPDTSNVSDGETTYTYNYLCQPPLPNTAIAIIPIVGLVANNMEQSKKDCHGHKYSITRVQVTVDSNDHVSDYSFNLSLR